LVHSNNQPRFERHFEAMIVWMDEKDMNINSQFIIKHGTKTTKARIDKMQYKVDVNTLEEYQVTNLVLNEIGRAVLTTNVPLAFDPYKRNKNTGSFILIDSISNNTCAVGMIIDKLDKKNHLKKVK